MFLDSGGRLVVGEGWEKQEREMGENRGHLYVTEN